MWAIGEPSGPIENGTTYIVRPLMQPSKRPSRTSRISAGSRQLLVGPASSSRSEQMKVRSSTQGPIPGAGGGEVEIGVWPLGVGEALEGAGVDQRLGERVVLGRGAVAPVDGVGLGQVGDLANPLDKGCVLGGRFRRDCLAHGPHSLISWART